MDFSDQNTPENMRRQREIAQEAAGQPTLYDRARAEYARVLRLTFSSTERHHNQAYMCFLRDFIAEHEGRDAETVQTEYERPANDDISRRISAAWRTV